MTTQIINKWEKRILGQSEAHLWVYKDQGGVLPTRAIEVLDSSEMARYEQYKFPDKKREFLIGRVFLKHVLAQYNELYPTRIRIILDNSRKPYLPDHTFYLSLSHSNGAYTCLIGQKPLGVDIEYLEREYQDIHYKHVFTQVEINHLEKLEGTARSEYFFQIWTMKEAFWKAHARQEELFFNQFSVTFNPLSIKTALPLDEHKSWHLSFEEGMEEYLIALAIEKDKIEDVTIQKFHFNTPIQKSLFTYP